MNKFPLFFENNEMSNCGKELVNQNLEVFVFYNINNKTYIQVDIVCKLYRISNSISFKSKNYSFHRSYGSWKKY